MQEVCCVISARDVSNVYFCFRKWEGASELELAEGGGWALCVGSRGSVNGNFKLKFRISLETNSGTLTVDCYGMEGSKNLNEQIIKQKGSISFSLLYILSKIQFCFNDIWWAKTRIWSDDWSHI